MKKLGFKKALQYSWLSSEEKPGKNRTTKIECQEDSIYDAIALWLRSSQLSRSKNPRDVYCRINVFYVGLATSFVKPINYVMTSSLKFSKITRF